MNDQDREPLFSRRGGKGRIDGRPPVSGQSGEEAKRKFRAPEDDGRKGPRVLDRIGNPFKTRGSNEDISTQVTKLARLVSICVGVAVFAIGFAITTQVTCSMTTAQAQAGMQDVVMTCRDVSAGEVLSSQNLTIVRVPRAYLASDAISDMTTVIGKTVVIGLKANAQLAEADILASSGSSTLASSLPEGKCAVTIDVDAASGISTLLHQGDRVDVVHASPNVGSSRASTIATGCRVLALDSQLAGTPSSYSSVTVEVTPPQAYDIRASQAGGTTTLVLMSTAKRR